MTVGMTLAWIDSREAFVVRWLDGKAHVEHLESDVPAHRTESGFTPQDVVEGHRLEHLTRFVGQVAARLPGSDGLLLIGPGTVREHLANAVERQDRQQHRTRPVACRAARPLTVPQLVALLRRESGEEAPRKPIRRRLRVARQPSRHAARADIELSADADLED